ncbi:hypothetical protein [Cellulomonas sp. JZ18]|nr:hypothetical protein [Cellulomonas sp. JZ18]
MVQVPRRPGSVLLDRPDLERPVLAVYAPLLVVLVAPLTGHLGATRLVGG